MFTQTETCYGLPKIIEYGIVECCEVTQKLKEGWELYGSPFAIAEKTYPFNLYFQAMVKREIIELTLDFDAK